MNSFKRCMQRQKSIDYIVDALRNEDINQKNLLVKDRIMTPAHYIVMLGETSSGKSALINSLFENKVLLESVKPTTGVVTEVIMLEDGKEVMSAINKDSNIEILNKDNFDNLAVNPNENLHRLRYEGKCKNNKYKGMRLFDTPGYGSLVDYHEEVLKEFIPESDFIIYVVSYRVGLGDDDLQFLKYVGEIIGKDIEIILAINMCPKDIQDNNKRIKEIKKTVNSCIHNDVNTFYIESSSEKKPDATVLWDYVYERINNDEKKKELSQNLKNYQDYILNECNIKVISKIANIQSEKETIEERLNIIGEFLDKKHEILGIIDRGFTKVTVNSVKAIDKSALKIKEKISSYIQDESKWSKKEETFTLMQNYYVPNLTNEEIENIINYIEDDIISLDRTIDQLLKESIANLEEKVKINIPSYTEVINGVVKQHIGDEIKQATGEMFRKANGIGESSLGNNNMEDVNLKKLANLVDTKSYKHTQENLKYLLKAIKASSIKAITHYLSVFTESIFYLYDSLTWQKKINEISLKAIDNWARDIEISIRKYLEGLKQTNKEEIMSLFDELSEEFKQDEKELKDIGEEELIKLKNQIEFLLNKCLYISIKK